MPETGPVLITLRQDEALILLELLARLNREDTVSYEDQAEQRVPWDLETTLERHVAREYVAPPGVVEELNRLSVKQGDVSADALLELLQQISPTIEGTFVGYLGVPVLDVTDGFLADRFTASHAQVGIRARGITCFKVLLKDPMLAKPVIRCFDLVRVEAVSDYSPAAVTWGAEDAPPIRRAG